MNPDIFAEWFRRQGHSVIKTRSSYWVNLGSRVYQAFPYHWLITPSEEELRYLLRQNKSIGMRYSTLLEASIGKISYHVVAEKGGFDLNMLPRRVRQDIRKGLEYANIELIPISRLAHEGWRLRHETLLRQGRSGAENETWWKRMCMSAEDLPGFEAWGAIHNGQLVSAMLAARCDDCYTFLYHQSATNHLKYGVNNAIFFSITEETLKRPEISQNFVALQSLDAPPSVDHFKFRMGYTAKPVRQRIVFHPFLRPMMNSLTHTLVRKAATWLPQNNSLAKAEGIMRFYHAGLLAIDQQTPPTTLQETSNSQENEE